MDRAFLQGWYHPGMQSNAPDVSTYLEQVPAERRDALNQLRRLCLELLPGLEESMEYGMPVYKRDGLAVLAFASQVQYIAFYIPTELASQYRHELPKDTGKCCIRYRNAKKIDFDLVKRILASAAKSGAIGC